jgi:hypothetical protein
MRMKAIKLVRATARFVGRILDAQLPIAESAGIRIR